MSWTLSSSLLYIAKVRSANSLRVLILNSVCLEWKARVTKNISEYLNEPVDLMIDLISLRASTNHLLLLCH